MFRERRDGSTVSSHICTPSWLWMQLFLVHRGYDSERVARFSPGFEISCAKCDRFQVFHICRYTKRKKYVTSEREILRGICHGCWECVIRWICVYTIYSSFWKYYTTCYELLVSRIFFPLENFRKSFYIYILIELLSFRFVSRESRQIEDPG